jgi:transposase-like protein
MEKQLKADMAKAETLADAVPSQGARRATEDGTASTRPSLTTPSDMEVVARTQRRQFSAADKQRILDAADLCTLPGEIGALLRREGVYSSSLSSWRHQRKANDLAALQAKNRGPKPDLQRADTQTIAQLRSDNADLLSRLEKAPLVIDIQKKVSLLLGFPNSMDHATGII